MPDLDLYHRWDLEPDQAVELARGCEAAGLAVDRRLTNSEGASVGNQRGVRVYGNSHGFLAGFASSSHSISCVLLASQDEDMQRDFWYSSARDPGGSRGPPRRSAGAPAKTRSRAWARCACATQRAPVMFIPEMARGLFRSFIGADTRRQPVPQDAPSCSMRPARACFRLSCRSRSGRISPRRWPAVRSTARAWPRATGSWSLDGVAQGYVLDSYSARKLGLRTTGNADGVHNLFIRSSAAAPTRAHCCAPWAPDWWSPN